MSTIETKFRSLSRLAAECQRQVERLYHVDSLTVQKEVADLIKSSIRCLEQDIEVKYASLLKYENIFFSRLIILFIFVGGETINGRRGS
jgi:hypothetical protein